MSEFGGFFRLIFDMLKGVGFFINTRMFVGKMLWEMYFMKLGKKHAGHHHHDFDKKIKALSANIQDINFSYLDKFSHIKTYCCMAFCCKVNKHPREFLTRSQYLYQKGYD